MLLLLKKIIKLFFLLDNYIENAGFKWFIQMVGKIRKIKGIEYFFGNRNESYYLLTGALLGFIGYGHHFFHFNDKNKKIFE